MPVTTVVVALALAVVIVNSLGRNQPASSWPAFGGWVVPGFLSAFATISFALGLLVLPFAVVAIVVASRLGVWPAALGFIAGAGLVGVLVWTLSVGEEGPEYSAWLAVGGGLALASVAVFGVWRRTV